MAIPPMAPQISSTPSGEASVRMMVPGVRNIPTAITCPMTRAVAAGRLSWRERCRGTLEGRSHRELERPGATRPEHSASRVDRLAEARGPEVPWIRRLSGVAHQHVRVSGVVLHADAEDVRHVE